MGSPPDLRNDKKHRHSNKHPLSPFTSPPQPRNHNCHAFCWPLLTVTKAYQTKEKQEKCTCRRPERKKKKRKNTGKTPRKLPSKTHMAPNCFGFNKRQEKKKTVKSKLVRQVPCCVSVLCRLPILHHVTGKITKKKKRKNSSGKGSIFLCTCRETHVKNVC